jgi:hypothetical protein
MYVTLVVSSFHAIIEQFCNCLFHISNCRMHALLKTIACMFSKVGGEERDKEISCNLERSALADFGELFITLVFFSASLRFLLKVQC